MLIFRKNCIFIFLVALAFFCTLYSSASFSEERFDLNAKIANRNWLFNSIDTAIQGERIQKELTQKKESRSSSQNPLESLQDDDFIFQKLINKKVAGVNCLNEAEIEIATYFKLFPEFENHENPEERKRFLKILMLDKYHGKSWPIYSDVPRVGTLEKIELEINYSEFPSENVCSNIQQVLKGRHRSLSSQEKTQLGLCNTSCNEVFGIIAERSRGLNDVEELALKICRRDISTSLLQRANLFGKLGDLIELSFSKDECQFPGHGTISCGHRRPSQLGLLDVKGVDLLAKQQLTITSGSLKKSFWINLDFYVQVTRSRTHRFNMILEYDMGETMVSQSGEPLTSTPDCLADVPVGELEFDDVYKRIIVSPDPLQSSSQEEDKNKPSQSR